MYSDLLYCITFALKFIFLELKKIRQMINLTVCRKPTELYS